MIESQVKPSPTDDEISVLSWPECARLCKSESPRTDDAIAFVWGQNDHVLRRFFETTALPNLRRLRIESPTWERGPGELFLGLAARGRPLEEMIVTTSLDLAKTRLVTFKVRFAGNGNLIIEYSEFRGPIGLPLTIRSMDVRYLVTRRADRVREGECLVERSQPRAAFQVQGWRSPGLFQSS